MRIYTIGFTKKNAETFFEILKTNNVKKIIDIRLNNISQLAGFAKGKDLEFFAGAILNINYKHDVRFAPTKDLLEKYKAGIVKWDEYENEFNQILLNRNIEKIVKEEYLHDIDGLCFLCSESEANQCHRRLVVEFIENIVPDLNIIHL